MHDDMLTVLQSIRDLYGKPIYISSGYRCKAHPVEAMKYSTGEHTLGMAVDIICHGVQALDIIRYAQRLGVNRIGIHQKGRASGRYIHVGIADKYDAAFPVALWTY